MEEVEKREFNSKERERLAESGAAMPDGSYPIVTVQDLMNAIQAFGRSNNPRATKEHIISRARALGAEDKLPEEWTKTTKSVWDGSFDPRTVNKLV